MGGISKEVASSAALEAHLRENPKDAHKIWPMAKAYADAREITFVETTIDISAGLTGSGWSDYDFGTGLPATCFKIRYYVRLTSGNPREIYFQTRRKGATIPQAGKSFSSYDVDTDNENKLTWWEWGDEQNVVVDTDGQIHMEYIKSTDGATIEVKVVGYWKKGA